VNALDYLIEKHEICTKDEPPFLLARKRIHYLPGLFRDLGYTTGAEIGVQSGYFSRLLCRRIPGLKLYAVDSWDSYGPYRRVGQAKMEQRYQRTLERLAPFDCQVIRAFSEDAAQQFASNSLDFVHLDANPSFAHAYQDIDTWSEKVQSGGIVSGHDYFNSHDLARCRVKDAVDLWTRQHDIAVWFVIVGSRYPSWFWVK